ncbi:class I adenylate-forming enzyme family protein [Streptomyces sp. DSM 41524]|uniref:Class I adenylate-forming enzyme family protein n=1 Tax=Streptomyces asiaticus subsp. ignotus TaxID=3098222 RepID=A0ABU7Q9K9_9ACTN|nr:class I adenylate-forming enzyme family protein [Streptomyces sp. DSM 41524]
MLDVELIRPIPELLVNHAARYGPKVAFWDDRITVSYADLATRTRRLAGHLVASGLAPGERVLILMNNRVEVAECYLALTRASLVGVCVNPLAATAELVHMVTDSGARMVITDSEHLEQVRTLLAGTPDSESVPIVLAGDGPAPDGLLAAPDGLLAYDSLVAQEPDEAPRDDLGLDSVAWMLYTSGTTGRPKGVLLTQRSCLWVVASCWSPVAGLSSDDKVLCALPLFHSFALDLCVLGAFAVGASERILPKFSTRRVLDLLQSDDYTVLPGVPTMFQYLIQGLKEHPGAERKDGALRLCLSAGAIMPGTVNAEFEELFGVQLLDGYGITETSTMVTMNSRSGGRRLGSCGLPLPGVSVRLVDPSTGEDVRTGQEGELWVSGPNVMAGYHRRPEATQEVLQHGWYRTGDLAQRDANGFLTICGRIKELIIRGGENIYPAEIEEALMTAEGVADAAVIARKHDHLGEEPVAFVVLDNPGELDREALLELCRSRLSRFKVPADIVEVKAIPRTGSGKIMRLRLQELSS